MKTTDFDYYLPEELIAQTPLKDRSSSRLMVINRKEKTYEDKVFTDLIDYLSPGDALVLNETKVLPARIYGKKVETGGAIELLLLKDHGDDLWECLARPQKRLKPGVKIAFPVDADKPLIEATVKEVLEDGITHIKFSYEGIFIELLERLGTMPLPPYIHEQLEDQSSYQTVYAKHLGSAAAPTAGLHFTPELLKGIEEKGVKIVKITLHVGLGTFRPVSADEITDHKMHTEEYEISESAANILNEVRKNGGKIFAVGTTSVRTLESNLEKHENFTPEQSKTSIFIYPGYKFRAIDGLITNFHLPKSTLIMLVSAFSSRELILSAYEHAVKEKYRFFSFGDAMLII